MDFCPKGQRHVSGYPGPKRRLLRNIDPFCCITILTPMLVWISLHFFIGYPDVICGIIIALWLFPKPEIWLWTFNNRKIEVRSSFLCLGPLMLPQAHLATAGSIPLPSKERYISNLLFFVNWMQQEVNTILMWPFRLYILVTPWINVTDLVIILPY